MSPTRILSGARRRLAPGLARFRDAQGGLAAVEFALVLPVMVTMYLGLVALTVGVNTDRKLTLVSRTVSDLTSRSNSVMSSTDLANIFGAATAVFAPYNPAGMTLAIASVYVKDTGRVDGAGKPIVTAKICWSTAREIRSDGTLANANVPAGWGKDSPVSPVPDGFDKPNSTYVVSQVVQQYSPMIGESVTGKINLNETTPWPVRNVPEITLQGQTPCLGT